MIGKTDLATQLGVSIETLRLAMRALEKTKPGFHVGNQKLLADSQAEEIRTFFATLKEPPKRVRKPAKKKAMG